MTPLIYAANGGHFEVTKCLLVAGASIEAKGYVSKTISMLTYMCVCVCVCVWRGEDYSSIILYDMIMSLL